MVDRESLATRIVSARPPSARGSQWRDRAGLAPASSPLAVHERWRADRRPSARLSARPRTRPVALTGRRLTRTHPHPPDGPRTAAADGARRAAGYAARDHFAESTIPSTMTAARRPRDLRIRRPTPEQASSGSSKWRILRGGAAGLGIRVSTAHARERATAESATRLSRRGPAPATSVRPGVWLGLWPGCGLPSPRSRERRERGHPDQRAPLPDRSPRAERPAFWARRWAVAFCPSWSKVTSTFWKPFNDWVCTRWV